MKSFSDPDDAGKTASVSGLVKSAAIVCAWCHPPVSGDPIGAVSHGICPRHFKELVLAFQNLAAHKAQALAVAKGGSLPRGVAIGG